MDLFELGCRCLDIPYLKIFMDAAGLLGQGVTVPLIGIVFWLYGFYAKKAKVNRVGWAVLAALLGAAIVVNVLKLAIQLPRPTPRSSYGFPSGDSGTAFSFAAVIATAFPELAPAVFLLATLAAISRVYFRAHYVWDVVGGALIGVVCGSYLARLILGPRPARTGSWRKRVIWVGTGVLALSAGGFFFAVERNIARHRVVNDFSFRPPAPAVAVDFGTDSARPYLLNGWSPNQSWRQPALSINWAIGRNASLNLPLDSGQIYRVRFRAYPYRPTGFTCQWIDMRLNDHLVQRIHLEQDWNAYEVLVPKELVHSGANRVEFHFASANTLDWHGINPERKALSVAFDMMQIIPDLPR
jgi:undecaprenyl-diphosphatase